MCVDAEHEERLFSVHSVRVARKIYVYDASAVSHHILLLTLDKQIEN